MSPLSTILLVLYLCVHAGVSCWAVSWKGFPRWLVLVPPWLDLYLVSRVSNRRWLGWLKTGLLLAFVFFFTVDAVDRQRVPLALEHVSDAFMSSLPLVLNDDFMLHNIDVKSPVLVLTLAPLALQNEDVSLLKKGNAFCNEDTPRQLMIMGAVVKLRIKHGEKQSIELVCH